MRAVRHRPLYPRDFKHHAAISALCILPSSKSMRPAHCGNDTETILSAIAPLKDRDVVDDAVDPSLLVVLLVGNDTVGDGVPGAGEDSDGFDLAFILAEPPYADVAVPAATEDDVGVGYRLEGSDPAGCWGGNVLLARMFLC